MQKLLICIVFCVTLSSIAGRAVKINAIWGARQPGDERLLYKIVKKDPTWLWGKDVEEVDYPGKGAFSTGNITYIEAINQKAGSGCSVSIKKGGVGFPFCILRFKTGRSEGCDYILQIYGRLNSQPQTQYVQLRPAYVQPQYIPPPTQYVQPAVQYVQPYHG